MRTKPQKRKNQKQDSIFDYFCGIEPLSRGQEMMIDYFKDGKSLIALGSAGTGKTYVAVALALGELISGRVKKIILVRSAVATRDIGFLPGTIDEKMEVYELPFLAIINDLLGRGDAYQILKQKGMIEFHPSSYLRGLTWDEAIVVIDEVQNLSQHELNTCMTRAGDGTRFIVCGDSAQADLPLSDSGIGMLQRVSKTMTDFFGTIYFTHADIVRSEFVRNWIIAVENHFY